MEHVVGMHIVSADLLRWNDEFEREIRRRRAEMSFARYARCEAGTGSRMKSTPDSTVTSPRKPYLRDLSVGAVSWGRSE